jgi:hypothetical protein
MSRNSLLLPLILCSVSLSAIDCTQCDCTHWPWTDECDECCPLKLLNNSSTAELKGFLALDKTSAEKLSALKAKGKIRSFEELKMNLGGSQIEYMQKQIKDLSPIEREYLLSPPGQKNVLHEKIMAISGSRG